MSRAPALRRNLLGALFVFGLLVSGCGRDQSAPVTLSAANDGAADESAVGALPSPAPSARPGLGPEPNLRGESPSNTVEGPAQEPSSSEFGTLGELVAVAGYPADATLGVLRVPVLGIEAPFAPRYVSGGAAELPLPSGPADVVWYDMSAWAGLGGAPGNGGNAIFSGHVDYAGAVPYAGVDYRGLGVFANLDLLMPGDVLEVEYSGELLRYQVSTVRQLSAAPGATDWNAVWSSDVPVDTITLYTCSGAFDAASSSYVDRVVLKAERI